MTAFPAPAEILGSFEHFNKRLTAVEWLASRVDRDVYQLLVAHIHGLVPYGATPPKLPDANEPFCWRIAYSHYVRLKREAEKPMSDAEYERRSKQAASDSFLRRMGERLVAQQAELQEEIRRGNMSAAACAYLGLQDGDLDDQTYRHENPQFGVCFKDNWQAVAERVDRVLSRWKNMSAAQKDLLAPIMLMNSRLAKVEREFAQLKQQQLERKTA